jgi:hypothetical protein
MCGMLTLASRDMTATTSNTYFYAFGAMLPIILAIILAFQNGSFGESVFTYALVRNLVIASVVVTLIVVTCQTSLKDDSLYLLGKATDAIVMLVVLFGMATIFNVFSNYFLRMGGVSGFIIRFLFFIPCLLRECLVYLLNDYATTDRVTVALLMVELLLISMYMAIEDCEVKAIRLGRVRTFFIKTDRQTRRVNISS